MKHLLTWPILSPLKLLTFPPESLCIYTQILRSHKYMEIIAFRPHRTFYTHMASDSPCPMQKISFLPNRRRGTRTPISLTVAIFKPQCVGLRLTPCCPFYLSWICRTYVRGLRNALIKSNTYRIQTATRGLSCARCSCKRVCVFLFVTTARAGEKRLASIAFRDSIRKKMVISQ
jgi:hypothetical protein